MKLLRRNLSLMLAVRYLNPLRTMFSVITLICLGGVALGVMVLIVVLSVMEGLQKEMENRVLAFTPHFVITLTDGYQRISLSREDCDWESLVEKIQHEPGVESVYPQLESDAFAQSDYGRTTIHFNALQPHNQAQLLPLTPMLREGTFDFGEGLDQECVISAATAGALGLGLGDSVHITPVGSLDQVADIYAMIQNPLLTQENKSFASAIATVFDASTPAADGGEIVEEEKLVNIIGMIQGFADNRLRQSEKDACSLLLDLSIAHLKAVPFSPGEKKNWQRVVAELAALDRDKEDGRAVKNINEMVMPLDLRIVGVYQPPENMPGPNIYMPLTIAQDVLGYSAGGADCIMGICVRLQDAHTPGDVDERISALLPDLSEPTETYPAGRHWSVIPWTKSFESWYELIANERVMMSFVLSIISLIASFCIMAVMFTMSMQRKREIAVLQALGATPGKIIGIFAWQGVIIGLLGAVSGVLLALLVLHYRLEIQAALADIGMDPFPMQAHGITLPASYEPLTFAKQAVMAFVMVAVASIIPAFIVSRQDPAKALRSN